MKGALMKAGQLISFIVEALPEEAQQALATLQAGAPPMAPSLAAEVVRESSAAIRSGSSWTGRRSPAAASISQVRRAVTRDGRTVAVKCSTPGSAKRSTADLANAEILYGMFAAFALKGLDTRALVDELRSRMVEELDYRLEARNQQAFAEHYAGHPFVRIPALVPGTLDGARAHHRVDRRRRLGDVRGVGRRPRPAAGGGDHLALRPGFDPADGCVQRRPPSRQLPLPRRRHRHVPRLRPGQAVVTRRVGAPGTVARRNLRARPGPPRQRHGSGGVPATWPVSTPAPCTTT